MNLPLRKWLSFWKLTRRGDRGKSPSDSGGALTIQEEILTVLHHLRIPAFFFDSSGQTFMANGELFRITGIPPAASVRWVYEFPLLGDIVSGKVGILRLAGGEYRVTSLPVEGAILFALQRPEGETQWLSELQFFLTALGHELKTPLTVIRGYAQILQGELGNQTEVAQKFLEQVVRLEETFNNFRSLSLLGRRGSISWREVTEVVALVVESWKEELRRKSLQWEHIPLAGNASPALPLSRGDFHLLFSNLFSNAVKFSSPGGKIVLSWVLQEDEILFELRNSLPGGVSPRELLSKWESFRKMKDLPEKNLGIYLIEKTLEKINGRLDVNFGSQGEVIFQVSLPSGVSCS